MLFLIKYKIKATKNWLTWEHRQEPRYGEQLRYEVDLVQMRRKHWFVECGHLPELGQVLLDYSAVVLQEELVEELRDERLEAGEGARWKVVKSILVSSALLGTFSHLDT